MVRVAGLVEGGCSIAEGLVVIHLRPTVEKAVKDHRISRMPATRMHAQVSQLESEHTAPRDTSILIGLISSQIVDNRNEEIKHDKEEHAILSPTIQSLTLKLQIYFFIGCRDIKHRRFCQAVMRTYRCWQYYGYCRKTCGACKYETNYTRNK